MKKLVSTLKLFILSFLFLVYFSSPAYAVDTAFGDVGGDAPALAQKFLNLAIGIAGGVAFLMMVFGAYRLIFSAGNPEAIQQGREVITAAISGLLVIVFSIFILRLIGISVLGLPIGE